MKKQLTLLALSVLILPAMAQNTNEFKPRHGGKPPEWKNKDRSEYSQKQRRQEPTAEQKAEHSERRLQFMKKSLKEIGVTEAQQAQIIALQKSHQEKMKAVSQQAGEARENLSRLQDEGATETELDAAIDVLSEAQSQQLKILVRNRMKMEKILGKEKNALLMNTARSQFRKHGRRGGSGLPPLPGQEGGTPPKPPTASPRP